MTDPRLRDIERDLDLLASGWRPDARTLDGAPRLDEWTIARDRRGVPCLEGLVSGHERLPGERRPIATSPLVTYDADAGWARTVSRWYRLGEPSPLMRAVLARRRDPAPEPPHP